MVVRRKRKLRYSERVDFKMKPETVERVKQIAEKKGIKVGKFLRQITEQYVWGYDNGPGKTAPAKAKNERLL